MNRDSPEPLSERPAEVGRAGPAGSLILDGRRRPAARASGAELAPGHLGLYLALGLHVRVDTIAHLVGRGRVEVDLLLKDVAQAAARHPDVVQVLHQVERVHCREIAGFVHQLHGWIVLGARPRRVGGGAERI